MCVVGIFFCQKERGGVKGRNGFEDQIKMTTKTGRPRKPTAILKLHGTDRGDRRYSGEPDPEVSIPDRPKFLKGEAKKEWDRIAPKLEKKTVLN